MVVVVADAITVCVVIVEVVFLKIEWELTVVVAFHVVESRVVLVAALVAVMLKGIEWEMIVVIAVGLMMVVPFRNTDD